MCLLEKVDKMLSQIRALFLYLKQKPRHRIWRRDLEREILRSAQDDRKNARALYQEERRQQKERESNLEKELRVLFPSR